MRDADLLAIQRGRLCRGECVKCGRDAHNGARAATLCRACVAVGWRYCHTCETVKLATVCVIPKGRPHAASVRCRACDNTRRKRIDVAKPDYLDMDTWRTRERKRVAARVAAVMQHYRAGLTIAQIADTLGMTIGQIKHTIAYARRTKRWPATLRRIERSA